VPTKQRSNLNRQPVKKYRAVHWTPEKGVIVVHREPRWDNPGKIYTRYADGTVKEIDVST